MTNSSNDSMNEARVTRNNNNKKAETLFKSAKIN